MNMIEFNKRWEEYNALCREHVSIGPQRIAQVVSDANRNLKVSSWLRDQNPWYFDVPRNILRPVYGTKGMADFGKIKVTRTGKKDEEGEDEINVQKIQEEVFFFNAFGWITKTECVELGLATHRLLITTHMGLEKHREFYQAQVNVLSKDEFRKTPILWELYTLEGSLGKQRDYAEENGFSTISIAKEENIKNGTVVMRALKGGEIELPVAKMLEVFSFS